MRVRPAVLMVLLFALGPSLAHALALGEIKLNSGLNEPLDAEIEVLSAAPEEVKNLSATVASRETFRRYGLDRPDFLSGLRFYVDRAGGRDVLRVVSTRPIAEPFVTFLVEAQWRRGRLLREYTVLLDPPVFLPTPERVAPAPVVVPRSVPSQVQPAAGQVVRQAPRRTPPRYSGTPSFGSTYGPIRRNETLWSIAERLRTDRSITMNQMMIAIYQANQGEFLGNINLMKEGSTLRIPTRAAIEAVSQPEAFSLAVAHNEAWRAGRPRQVARAGTAPSTISAAPDTSRLRLVEPDQAAGTARDVSSGAGATADAATAETLARNEADIARLSSENEQLRADLEEIKRLLSVRDAELAQMQQQLSEGPAITGPAVSPDATATVAADAAADTAADVVDAPAAAVVDDVPAGDDVTAADAADPLTGADQAVAADTTTVQPDTGVPDQVTDEPEPVQQDTAPAPVATTSLPDEPGIVGKVLDMAKGALGSLWLWIGLGVLALAGFGAVALRGRSAGEPDAIEALTREAMAAEETGDTTMLPQLDIPSGGGEPSGDVEFFDDSGTFKPVDFAAAQPVKGDSGEYPFEDTIGGEVQLDQSDPLAEADFHMAYGLYDQASDLVKKAVAKEPERIDLRMKLLEIFFVWGNQDEFRNTAQDLRDNMPEQIAGEWDKIVIMGKQICPDDALFAGDAGIGTGADIDLEFEPTGSQESVDLDTGVAPAVADDAIDLDFGDALGDETAPPPLPDTGDTVEELLDLNLGGDDPLLSDVEEEEDTMPEPVEQIKDQIKARLSSTDTDETAEMDLSDLGVDLELASTGQQPVKPAEDSAEADFGDVFSAAGEVEATSELPAPTTELTAGGNALDLDIGDMFGGLDSEDDEETARDLDALEESMEQTGPADTADTGQFSAEVETLHGDALDVDIGAFDDSDTDATRLIAPEGDADAAFSSDVFSDGSDDETRMLGPDETGPDAAFSSDVFGDSADVTKMIGPDEATGSHTEDAFSAAVFGEDETVQVAGGDEEIVIDTGTGVDLDIGESLDEGDDMTTAKVATSDLALPEAGDDLSEVGTKLDLARAYMDMGDPDGARGILEEVLAEGNETQQSDARDMLASLG